jgi:hypothetical protein
MASIALGIAALLGTAGSVTSAVLGSNAATTAAGEQEQEEQQAIQLQQQMFEQEQGNIAPFLTAGQSSIAGLVKQLQNGTFGAGSLPSVPTAPAPFTQPTLAQAENEPGYQFALQQGLKGVAEEGAAGGGAVSGGTIKAADQYANNLAETNYGNVFNQALSTYNAGLSQYASQLQGYQTGLAGQQQAFGQELAPAELGLQAAGSLNSTAQSSTLNIAQLLQALGSSAAAGTVGSTNAITGAIGGATSNLSQIALLNLLLGGGLGGNVSDVPGGTTLGTTPGTTMPNLPTLPTVTQPVAPPVVYGEGPGDG